MTNNQNEFDDLLGDAPAKETNLDIALRLAAQGIPVFPCRWRDESINGELRKEKSPITRKGFKDASADADVIKIWWRVNPNALVGMPTGAASGIAALDLDRHDPNEDGVVALAKMGFRPEKLSPAVVTTAGNGLHVLFAWDKGVTNSAKHLPSGMDIRGEGGYIIASGSSFPDGRSYSHTDLSVELPPFPNDLRAPEHEVDYAFGGDKAITGLSVEEIRQYMEDLPNSDNIERTEWLAVMASLKHEASGLDLDGKQRSKAEQDAICDIAMEWTARAERYSAKEHLAKARADFKSLKNEPHRNLRTFRSIIMQVDEIRRNEGIESDFDEIDDIEADQPDNPADRDDPAYDAATPETGMFEDLFGDGGISIKGLPKALTPSQQRLARSNVEDALGREAPKWVRKLNARHAVAMVSGKCVILHFKDDGTVHYGTSGHLHDFYENNRVAKDKTTVPITKVWMQSKYRRSYPEGIVFAPNREVVGAYNHWQGFSVEASRAANPQKGCIRFLEHLRYVVCNGNEAHYRYHLGWLAHMVQFPEEKPGVAVVYKGRKRIGKDTLFEYVGALFAHHYITVANQDQMLGKFNAHQEKCLLLHMQEGFWAGNKQAEGMLKYLITSAQVMIEPKGLNAFPITSVLRLFISSNERWIVPATEDEGRFFVLNVSEVRRGDHAYFGELREEMRGDGPASLLAYLMAYDISDFQVRAVPDTDALAEQKDFGLRNVEKWWRETLQRGGMQNGGGIDSSAWIEGPIRVEKNEFRDNYVDWMRTKRFEGEEASDIEFGRRIRELCPSVLGKQLRIGGARSMVYNFPSLKRCREDFEQRMGSTYPWADQNMFSEVIYEEDDEI